MFFWFVWFFFPRVRADYDSARRAATSEEKTGCPGIIPQYTLCSYWLHSCFSHSSPPHAMRKTYRQEKNHCQSNKLWLASLLPVNACEERRACGECNRGYYLWVNTNFMSGWPSPACYWFFLSWVLKLVLPEQPMQSQYLLRGNYQELVQVLLLAPIHRSQQCMSSPTWEDSSGRDAQCHSAPLHTTIETYRKQDFCLGIGLFKAKFPF